MKHEKKTTVVLMTVYLVILTWIILFKLQFSFSQLPHMRKINFIPFAGSVIVNGKTDFNEIINNFIVFIPVGIYLSMLKTDWSFWRKTGSVCSLSFIYESLQFIFAIGASDITDLISNTLGGAAGMALFLSFSKILKEKTNKILNILASICTLLLTGFIALILIYNNLV